MHFISTASLLALMPTLLMAAPLEDAALKVMTKRDGSSCAYYSAAFELGVWTYRISITQSDLSSSDLCNKLSDRAKEELTSCALLYDQDCGADSDDSSTTNWSFKVLNACGGDTMNDVIEDASGQSADCQIDWDGK